MFAASVLAQEASTTSGSSNGTILLWILGAGIVGLYILINRTRKRSYREYMSRAQREEDLKANDPDMRQE